MAGGRQAPRRGVVRCLPLFKDALPRSPARIHPIERRPSTAVLGISSRHSLEASDQALQAGCHRAATAVSPRQSRRRSRPDVHGRCCRAPACGPATRRPLLSMPTASPPGPSGHPHALAFGFSCFSLENLIFIFMGQKLSAKAWTTRTTVLRLHTRASRLWRLHRMRPDCSAVPAGPAPGSVRNTNARKRPAVASCALTAPRIGAR